MNSSYQSLFQPGFIGTLAVKNRLIKAPMVTCLGAPDGSVTDRLLDYYAGVARGGVGLVIVEDTYIDLEGSQSQACQLSAADTTCIPGLSFLARTIRDNGAKAALQLGHCGLKKRLGTSPVKCVSYGVPVEEFQAIELRGGAEPSELTIAEIRTLVTEYGEAAFRAWTAGFDMVEIHGAHVYLVNQFLSPHFNHRADIYGGSSENRVRFLIEVIEEIRKKTGPDFPVGVRLNGSEYEPGGLQIEDTVRVAGILEQLGVNSIHVSGGGKPVHIASPMSVAPGHHVWAAEAVKKTVKIPVIASGSINSVELAESILKSGKADFISMARPLLADPDLPQKVRDGRTDDIVPCIRCNDGCGERSNDLFRFTQCTVNAAAGREARMQVTPAKKFLKVAVIGGGPAGLEAARVCALRGHRVTLFEKRKLGGALIEASVPDFKADLRPLIRYLENQVRKLKIDIIFSEANVDIIKTGGFQSVILATGAIPQKPDVPGINTPGVYSVLDILRGRSINGSRVYIAGGGVIGVETGLWLAEQGKEVIFSTRQERIMSDANFIDRISYLERLKIQKVTVYTGAFLKEIFDGGARITGKEEQTIEIAADTVVYASGFTPDNTLQKQLEQANFAGINAIGDCVKPRRIFDAIHEGNEAARMI